MNSPRERLAGALDLYCASHNRAVTACAAGVSSRQFANAETARPVAAVPFLRICAVIGYDPLPEVPKHAAFPKSPSDFDFAFFSMAFWMKRGLNGHSHRQAGEAIGVSASTVCRIERGDAMFIGVVLRACRYLDIHPFGYFCVPEPAIYGVGGAVSRGTEMRSNG